jgi:F0F1-type ATP synthase membrane subunit b/b'
MILCVQLVIRLKERCASQQDEVSHAVEQADASNNKALALQKELEQSRTQCQQLQQQVEASNGKVCACACLPLFIPFMTDRLIKITV